MDRQVKLNALRNVAMAMGEAAAPLGPLLGFFAGRIDGVRFVKDDSDASLYVYLATASRLWPKLPFRAKIDGEAVNNPFAFIERAALRDDPIEVKVDFGVDAVPEWYEAAVERSADPREALHESIEQIRRKIDLALDVYRTASEARVTASEEEQAYLRFVLEKAKAEMRELNLRLTRLEEQLSGVE
mgnify:CR=1 FL=1